MASNVGKSADRGEGRRNRSESARGKRVTNESARSAAAKLAADVKRRREGAAAAGLSGGNAGTGRGRHDGSAGVDGPRSRDDADRSAGDGGSAGSRGGNVAGTAADSGRRATPVAASDGGSRRTEAETRKAAPDKAASPRVTPPKRVLADVPDSLDEAAIRAIYKGAFKVPALAGYGPFWELSDFEAKALSEPTARMVNSLDPALRVIVNKVADPLTVVGSLAVLVSARMEMTRSYMHELRIQREVEARRAALSRASEDRNPTPDRGNLRPNPNGDDAPATEASTPQRSASTKDLFTSSEG